MARSRRRSLGVLFALLAVLFGAVGGYAVAGRAWVVAAAAVALCAWMAELSYRTFR